jgi:ribosomal protein L40E
MQCAKCGYQNPDEAEECQQCGINLAWAAENITEPCPACNTPNPVFAQKCSNCGLNLQWEKEERKRKEEEQRKQQERELAAKERASQAQLDAALTKEKARTMARDALIAAIVGIFLCGIILEPYAIDRARKAKKILSPGEEGRGKANAAEIIGWIAVVLWVLGVIVTIADYF